MPGLRTRRGPAHARHRALFRARAGREPQGALPLLQIRERRAATAGEFERGRAAGFDAALLAVDLHGWGGREIGIEGLREMQNRKTGSKDPG